jgi:hypothetical protein
MSTNGTMKRSSLMDGSAALNYAGIAAALGGILGLAGVYLYWFKYSYPAAGGTLTQYLGGYEDWTGQVAFIAGIATFAFSVAYMLLLDPQIRRLTGALMGISAVILLGASIAGFFRVGTATADQALLGADVGAAVKVTTGVAGGLLVSAVGGIFAVVGAVLSLKGSDQGSVSGP